MLISSARSPASLNLQVHSFTFVLSWRPVQVYSCKRNEGQAPPGRFSRHLADLYVRADRGTDSCVTDGIKWTCQRIEFCMMSQGCTLICFFQDTCRATANTWPPDSFKKVVFYWPPARELRTYCCGSHVSSLLTPEHSISRASVKELVSSISTVSHYNSD